MVIGCSLCKEGISMKKYAAAAFVAVVLPLLFIIAVAGWRIDLFQICDCASGKTLFSAPSAIGHTFTTRYIHSVELTPVEDEYKIVDGRLWAWEERVRSSNAGMPFSKPVNGRFISTPRWLIFQGSRVSWHEYYYRIGNKKFGLNQVLFEPFGRKNFYGIFAGKRLVVKVITMPYMFAKVFMTRKLAEVPEGVPPVESCRMGN